MTKGRNFTLVRTLAILRLFQAKGRYKPDVLAELFGVTKRTIFRDLDALQQAGYPLTSVERGHDGQGTWWMI